MTYNYIFKDSFNTFKVFNNLTVKQVNRSPGKTPQTIWQILNHLALFQEYQLKLLKGKASTVLKFDEAKTWLKDQNVQTQTKLNEIVTQILGQLDEINLEINILNSSQSDIPQKLKIIQELSLHLSFHLGEIVLIRRMNDDYPHPNEMKEFLS